MTGKKDVKKTADTRDQKALNDALKALQATQHNPVNFAPIIALVAPILARIAARYVLRRIVRKYGKRLPGKIRDETVNSAADYIAGIAVKRTLPK